MLRGMRDAELRARYGPHAVITGAAQGIGAELAGVLAERGLGVVLVDVQHERARAIAERLAREHGASTRALGVDLTSLECASEVARGCADLDVGLLVNNAGIPGAIGPLLDLDVEAHLAALHVNARAALLLTHHFGQALRARRRGGIVFLSSLAALQGSALVAHYGATKAYDLALAEALGAELHEHGVDVLAAVVGATRTPGFESAQPKGGKPRGALMEARSVAVEIVGALGTRRVHVVGRANRAAALALGLLPRRWSSALVSRETRRIFGR